MKTASKSVKRIVALCIVIILIVVVSQIFRMLYSPVTTSSVLSASTFSGVDMEVISVRNEKVVTTSKNGVFSYRIADGDKISNGGVIADIYESGEDIKINEEIERLTVTVNDLEEINGYNTQEAVNIDLIDSKIREDVLEVVNNVSIGKIGNASNYSQDILKLMNRRQIATGTSGGFDDLLSTYKDKLKSLKTESSSPISKIKSKTSGYFVSGIDGYETVVNEKDLNKLTPDKYDKLKPDDKEYTKKTVGKIVSDYEWYLAAKIPLEECLKFKENDQLVLRTDFDSVPELPVTVHKINKGMSGDSAVVIFSCTYMNSDLASMRRAQMTAVLETYTGLGVNAKAIRFVKGEKGVYVLTGNIINFVPVNVLYSQDNYCICEMTATGNRLKLYDEIIVKGKNLYDGKVID